MGRTMKGVETPKEVQGHGSLKRGNRRIGFDRIHNGSNL
jgi:hypothetical protein